MKTLRTLIIAAGCSGALLLGFWKITVDDRDEAIAELEALTRDMRERLEAREAMIERLSRSHRIAHVEIVEQPTGAGGEAIETSFLFIELDDDGSELARQSFTVPGDVLFIDAWTVKFAAERVALGHPLFGRSLVLLRRVYSDRMMPADGFAIDTPGAIPPGYAAGDLGRFEQRLWEHFWEIATDAALAQAMGVRVAQGEAVYKPVSLGQKFDVVVDATGGMSLTPVAAAGLREPALLPAVTEHMSKRSEALRAIEIEIPRCRRCPELRAYCAEVASTKRRAYIDFDYWGKPVPGFGDHRARILIAGLAPGAHGANRTGRMFTGDRSGDFLYAALRRAGFANQATSTDRDDGLALRGVYIGAALRCAPPANRPTAEQLRRCSGWLCEEIRLLSPKVTLCLGGIGWNAVLSALRDGGHEIPRPRPKFAHGKVLPLGPTTLLGCYHVSQLNTFTGRLTEEMIDTVMETVRELVAG